MESHLPNATWRQITASLALACSVQMQTASRYIEPPLHLQSQAATVCLLSAICYLLLAICCFLLAACCLMEAHSIMQLPIPPTLCTPTWRPISFRWRHQTPRHTHNNTNTKTNTRTRTRTRTQITNPNPWVSELLCSFNCSFGLWRLQEMMIMMIANCRLLPPRQVPIIKQIAASNPSCLP